MVPGLAGSSRYSAEAIVINGLACAVGRRGHNVVVLDPSTGRIEHSRAFDTGGADEAAGQRGAEELSSFLSGLPEGRAVLMAVIGSGHHASAPHLLLGGDKKSRLATAGLQHDDSGTAKQQAVPAGLKEAWLMAGLVVKTAAGDSKLQQQEEWWVCEARTSGRGPARAVISLPLALSNTGEDEAAAEYSLVREGRHTTALTSKAGQSSTAGR